MYCKCGNLLAPHDDNGQCDACYIKDNTKYELKVQEVDGDDYGDKQ